MILTPKPGSEPKINGAHVFGVRPGRPFVYRIPCTGVRPILFSADGLPASLCLDPATGVVTGHAPVERGTYAVKFRASNDYGEDSRDFSLVVGDKIALTPPMGWNSWYHLHDRVTEQHMRDAADVMVSSGMADFGYQYVNIDDCWAKKLGDEPYWDEHGAGLQNANFPDMHGMVEYIHSLGLRAGTYGSPGPWTCAEYVGSYDHEIPDAQQYADWGFDLLKYDQCSYAAVWYGEGLEKLQRPWSHMSSILETLDRDIVFNICQYGQGDVWEWGAEVGGHCWRTTGDLGLEEDGRLPAFYDVGFSNARHCEHAGPGEWNDPDYVLIGWLDSADKKKKSEPTTLTHDEQYSHMSMWCLMAAPLIFGGDMSKLDEFTLNVLCNAEVIEIDQDPLGRQGHVIRHTEDEFVLAKPMSDGSLAVGLFNLCEEPRVIRVDWNELGLSGQYRARDCWRQTEFGVFEGVLESPVAVHGVALFRMSATSD